MNLDDSWMAEVIRECDPVFAAAEVGFELQVSDDALLWEATPGLFAERYPDSGIVETYGDQWPEVHCLDWWVYLEPTHARARICVEGWNLPEVHLPLTGHASRDACSLADLVARLLGVPSPRV